MENLEKRFLQCNIPIIITILLNIIKLKITNNLYRKGIIVLISFAIIMYFFMIIQNIIQARKTKSVDDYHKNTLKGIKLINYGYITYLILHIPIILLLICILFIKSDLFIGIFYHLALYFMVIHITIVFIVIAHIIISIFILIRNRNRAKGNSH